MTAAGDKAPAGACLTEGDVPPTPLEHSSALSELAGFDVWLKREDLFPLYGGGSKGRKTAALADELSYRPDVIISVGGIHSNHIRSCSALAHHIGAALDLVVHSTGGQARHAELEEALGTRTLQLCTPDAVANELRELQVAAQLRGERVLVVPGGGHHAPGVLAYQRVGRALLEQCEELDLRPGVVALPSGTGGTQAGLIAGLSKTSDPPRVVGISVGRDKTRGIPPILEALEWVGFRTPTAESVQFVDSLLGRGYGSTTPSLRRAVDVVRSLAGLEADPVYTGRMFEALLAGVPELTPAAGTACVLVVTA